MHDFDDEPSTGGGYDRVIDIPLGDPDGIPRRIAVRLRHDRSGRLDRVSVSLEERRADVEGRVMRFDDAHDHYHRHHAGWPEPGPIAETLDHIGPRQRAPYARDQIRLRYHLWEAEIFGKGQSR